MGGACSTHGRDKCIQNLIGKNERKRLFGIHKRIWEHNIKRMLGEEGGKLWTGVMWPRIGTNGRLL